MRRYASDAQVRRAAMLAEHLAFVTGCVLLGMTPVHQEIGLTGLGGVLYFISWPKKSKP